MLSEQLGVLWGVLRAGPTRTPDMGPHVGQLLWVRSCSQQPRIRRVSAQTQDPAGQRGSLDSGRFSSRKFWHGLCRFRNAGKYAL